jgi:hypothetical protein
MYAELLSQLINKKFSYIINKVSQKMDVDVREKK